MLDCMVVTIDSLSDDILTAFSIEFSIIPRNLPLLGLTDGSMSLGFMVNNFDVRKLRDTGNVVPGRTDLVEALEGQLTI